MRDLSKVPAEALTLAAGRVELADSKDGLVPIEMVARSNDPIDHWYWGRNVHDNESFTKHKDVLPVDYLHDEEIGFLNEFEFDPERGLVARGYLVPTDEPNDTARKLIAKSKGGIPYEASINFAGDGIKIREYAAGELVEVNGREFEGPITVFSNWPLRGVAVCPYGADAKTSSQFSNKDFFNLEQKDKTMAAKPKTKELTAEVAEVETETEVAEEVATETVVEVETPTEQPAELKANDPRAEAKKFVAAFGEKGAVWYAEGLDFEQARNRQFSELQKTVDALSTENKELKTKLSIPGVQDGEADPVSLKPGGEETKKKGFAANIRLRK